MRTGRSAPRLALSALLVGGFVLARAAGFESAAALAVAGLVALVVAPLLRNPRTRLGVAIGLGAVGALLAIAPRGLAAALQALPLIANALMALHFGASLRPGREPLIALYSRLDWGRMPPECEGYTRRLTWLWTLVSAGLTLVHGLALILDPLEPELVLAANAVIICGLFLGEHIVRTIRFPELGVASPLRTCRAVLLAGAGAAGAPAATHHAR